MGTKIKKYLFALLIAIITLTIGISYASAAPGEITVTKSAVKIDEIYGEDSIEVLYLEDRQMNSKIIYKEEGGSTHQLHLGLGSCTGAVSQVLVMRIFYKYI